MLPLLEHVKRIAPNVAFEAGTGFCWSPEKHLITYLAENLHDDHGQWALLHETAHSQLDHTSYQTDFELLMMEVAAWQHAVKLGEQLGINIDTEHVQDCLDTYRDWLHRRSTCPTCGCVSLQRSTHQYACHNCPTTWKVTTARFCRPYRLKQGRMMAEKEETLHPTFT